MTKEEIKDFVKTWMDGHESDTFIKNENGVVVYSAGHTSLNLTCFFEDLLSDFIESKNVQLKAESITEYISRLKEVLKHTGKITEIDIDYVYGLIQHDLDPKQQ